MLNSTCVKVERNEERLKKIKIPTDGKYLTRYILRSPTNTNDDRVMKIFPNEIDKCISVENNLIRLYPLMARVRARIVRNAHA